MLGRSLMVLSVCSQQKGVTSTGIALRAIRQHIARSTQTERSKSIVSSRLALSTGYFVVNRREVKERFEYG